MGLTNDHLASENMNERGCLLLWFRALQGGRTEASSLEGGLSDVPQEF